MPRFCLALLMLLFAAFTVHAAATTSAPAPATRPQITTPLVGDALAAEFDQRFGIWFVREKLPPWATVTLPENATADEGLTLLRQALTRDQGGFQTAEVPGANHDVFQLIATDGKPLPCQFGTDVDQIPISEDRLTQIIPLKNLDAARTIKDLAPLFSTDAVGSVDAAHNCLIITETSAKVNRLVQIINKLDRPVKTVTESRQLKYTKAADTAYFLNVMFDVRGSGHTTGTPIPRPPANSGQFYADYDEQTNTISFTGPPELVAQAIDQIARIESQAATAPAVFFIPEHRKPQSITPVLEQIFGPATTSAPASAPAPLR